ncbi:anchored repeat-type ABC transporter ATP-binding subunit [Corynebacterium urogenitale]
MSSPVLSVRRLAVQLSGRRVLSDVTLDLERGEFVGLLGPNGAGKTTLLRSILGFIPVDSGSVSVEGRSRAAAVRRAVGYVPQRHEFAWEFPLSVREAVLGGRVVRRGLLRRAAVEDHKAALQALKKVNLEDKADRPIGQLSGGQRQRVLVARALAAQPEVLLLDEPFTGMDVPNAEQLIGLFKQLADEGTTVLMSTHDLGEAVDHCERLVLLNGSVQADSARDDLRQAEPWMRAYGVRENSSLLRTVGVVGAA